MIFGIREKKTVLGSFTSDKCASCKKSIEYRMEKTVRYLVIFGINLIPLRVRYESVCGLCGTEEAVKGRTARSLAQRHFADRQFAQRFFMVLRLVLAAAVIAAAVALPLTIKVPVSRDPEVLKALVSADGDYAIKDADDELLAIIHVENGVKTLTWYDKVSELKNTGNRGGRFYLHESYKEAVDGSGNTILIRDIDDPGRLVDQYNSVVRLYSYDEASDALTFYQGVEDLAAIEYKNGRVTYHNIRFDEAGQKQEYVTVLYILSNAQLRAQFIASESGVFDKLFAVSIDSISGGRVTDQRYYYLDDDAITLAMQAGLTQDSDAQAIADFIRENGLAATIDDHFEFYGNTRVVQSEVQTLPDANGDMQTSTIEYEITAGRGYYVFPYAGQ